MTVYLALDAIAGHDLANRTGLIRIINPTIAGLQTAATAAGLDRTDYNGLRLRAIDETDSSVWDDDCQPGWYLVEDAVQQSKPLTDTETVAVDISNFRDAVEREAVDWERVLAEENFNPHLDSGHSWSDDLLHALLVPNIRGLVVLLETAKATPNAANITAYRARLDSFIGIAADPGVLSIYRNGDKAVWRPKRDGLRAYAYDTTTGGVRANVSFAVSYPTGETVVTWDALGAVRSL